MSSTLLFMTSTQMRVIIVCKMRQASTGERNLPNTIDTEVNLYSDDCTDQHKNKFMLGLYFYAVRYLGIKSITHTYMIRCHIQNEGDSAYYMTERQMKRQLRRGPLKGLLLYEDLYYVKHIASVVVDLTTIKLADMKVIKVQSEPPYYMFCRRTYCEDFQDLPVIKKRKIV
ncbi:hypothetical protein PR048_004673 [Dryococelus australis]|uniref:Uncharacterized protein n=1 Tax=Dryococelus australis TaxID=614101 RepID=A0ABQ9I636_9NEOP|nr:hypothetical protein PR048_004673 [Dryococelus australis]